MKPGLKLYSKWMLSSELSLPMKILYGNEVIKVLWPLHTPQCTTRYCNKKSRFLKKNCLKRCHFNLKMKSFQNIPKVKKYSVYFLRRSANKNFQKSPDLVTLTPTTILLAALSENIHCWEKYDCTAGLEFTSLYSTASLIVTYFLLSQIQSY